MMQYEYIPLGTRCSTAYVLRDNLGLRRQSLPFDWVDIPIQNIKQFIDIKKNEIPSFIDNYFNQIPKTHDRHPDGTWFPHDKFTGEIYEDALSDIKDKYCKRLERLHDLFQSDKRLVFLTVFSEYNPYNIGSFLELKGVLSNKCLITPFFISVNLFFETGSDGRMTASSLNEFDHVDYSIEKKNTDTEFKEFEAEIARQISTWKWTKHFFEKQ
jgi:hypothetical protein